MKDNVKKNDWYSQIKAIKGLTLASELDDSKAEMLELPTPSINWALGGGLAFGKTLTVYGPEQAGKSFIALMAVAQLHKTDPDAWAIWYDAEFSFDKNYAAKMGVDINRLMIQQTNKPKEVFNHFAEIIWPLIQDGFPLRAFVLDSIKALRGPREDAAADVESHVMGDISSLLNKAFRLIIEPIRKHKILTILVQQVNEEMDQTRQMQGHKWRVPSGQALKHFSDYMVLVEKVDGKKTKIFDETHKDIRNLPIQLGHRVRCKVEKNRTDVPHLTAEFQFQYGVGVVNTEQEIAELAVNIGVVDQKGATYTFGNHKAIGIAKFIELIKKTPELKRELLKAVNDKPMFKAAAEAPVDASLDEVDFEE